ncbi:uroporphyrinogen-III synthase [Halobacillus shinanisalinarum]|uniref:Uroporphyrinogen-III synthase n=1 Tax=Halobacillus shinanisalinarum TaxID=2932258 RepID=A0ABY4H0F8_9BACI|nr:uroporphyrinogen-III synthase [Halobacillus shinanisalinarum]UOQ93137.1 uroporphyrinogen-III synthase [Halobacillus shinanisalinarum]
MKGGGDMNGLDGKQIGVAADRSADPLSNLIQKKGGSPVVYSIQGKQSLNEQTSHQNIKDFLAETFEWAIFTTGIGAKTLADSSVELGFYSSFIEKLNDTNLAIRGKKTLNWCKNNAVQVSMVSEDGTMENLLKTFSDKQMDGIRQRVFLQAYNQDDAKLKDQLEKLGCSVYLSRPYSYQAPIPQVLNDLKKAVIEQSLDAVVFTSKTQVKNLLANHPDTQKIVQAFNEQVLAVAVGKVTANELKRNGILNVLQPDNPKMGPMVVALDRYYQQVNN